MSKNLLNKFKTGLKIGAVITLTPLVLAFGSKEVNATPNHSSEKINSPEYAEEVVQMGEYQRWKIDNVWYSDMPLEEYSVPDYIFDSTPYDSIRMNPFYQPNDSTLDWYGSGDLDSNNVLDQADLDSMLAKNGIEDQADTDGNDTAFTSNDYSLLFEHITNDSLLPSDWNMIGYQDSAQQKLESWLEKMKPIDKTDTITYREDFKCGEFSMQTIINFNGFKELKDSSIVNDNISLKKYDFFDNGRFNIPMFYTTISSDETLLRHAIVTTLTKDNPLNFNNWYFIEPQDDSKVKPGDWSMPNDSQVKIYHSFFFYAGSTNKFYFGQEPFIKFKLNNGVPELVDYDERLILERPVGIKPGNQNLLEKFVLNQNYPNPFNSQTQIKYSLPVDDKATLNVYNLKGNLVETLVNEKQRQGEYTIGLDASKYSSGIYIYRLSVQGSGINKTKKMVLVK